MPHILSVSYDLNLLNTRQLMLEASGYTVTLAEGYVDAIRKCRASNYDLLIIGHSIPDTDKERLVREMSENCPCPVLAHPYCRGMTASAQPPLSYIRSSPCQPLA